MMTNKEIARLLKETSLLIELTGGNPFRARAFGNAARLLERLEAPARTLLDEQRLTDLKGIGDGLSAQIGDLLDRGSFDLRDDLLNAVPAGILDILRIKGLGAKRVRRLWQELGITSLEDLEAAALSGRLADLDGFGNKSEQQILQDLNRQRIYLKRRRYADAFLQAETVLAALEREPEVQAASMTGELRRQMETVGNVALLAKTDNPAAVLQALNPWNPRLEAPDHAHEQRITGTLPDGFPFSVYVAPTQAYGTAQWLHTGPKAYVAHWTSQHGQPGAFADEADLYAAAGLDVLPPPLRDDPHWPKVAAESALPRLIQVQDLRGSLHNHSTYSDGSHTLQAMAEAARAQGLSYFGICDHSRSLKIANGMPVERVREQQAEIRHLNAGYEQDGGPPFTLFSGIESDILSDGALDYPEAVLASFDFVVASIHTGFNMTSEEATARIIRAVENPYTTILGHPTGRLLLAREGYPLDHEQVIEACAQHNVALELNANPYRLDLDWRWIRMAVDRGVPIAINPDAHAIEQLAYVRWGVAVAQKGGLSPDQCLNTRSREALAKWLTHRLAAKAV